VAPALWATLAPAARAQVALNRANAEGTPSDLFDARALWVNPGALALTPQASLHLGLSMSDPGSGGRLRQGTVSLNARGLALGYQHDVFANSFGDTYRAAVAGGQGGLSGGLAVSLYRDNGKATGWDAGVVFARNSAVTLAGVLENLGQPVVRGEELPTTLVPSATLHPLGGLLAVSALGRFSADSALGFAAAARLTTRGTSPLGLLFRIDWDRTFHRTGLTFGLALGGQDELGVAGSTMTGASGLAAGDFYGISTRTGR
jgi:hypothetical protein